MWLTDSQYNWKAAMSIQLEAWYLHNLTIQISHYSKIKRRYNSRHIYREVPPNADECNSMQTGFTTWNIYPQTTHCTPNTFLKINLHFSQMEDMTKQLWQHIQERQSMQNFVHVFPKGLSKDKSRKQPEYISSKKPYNRLFKDDN